VFRAANGVLELHLQTSAIKYSVIRNIKIWRISKSQSHNNYVEIRKL
jgi:hypothetical protein